MEKLSLNFFALVWASKLRIQAVSKEMKFMWILRYMLEGIDRKGRQNTLNSY